MSKINIGAFQEVLNNKQDLIDKSNTIDDSIVKYPSNKAVKDNSNKYITNCITEIPQDIKLELANGVQTLKAGSKVYVPNGKNADGSLKFDEVIIPSDISRNYNLIKL